MAFGGALLLVFAWGCGGKVVVDSQPEGTGGNETSSSSGTTSSSSSASSSSSSVSSSSSSGTGFTCDLLCGGPIGLCACGGPCCDGKMRGVGCGGDTASGFTCSCDVNGEIVGQCDETSLICALPQSCCWAIFGG